MAHPKGRRRPAAAADSQAAGAPDQETKAGKSKTLTQLVVIGACAVLGAILLLTTESAAPPAATDSFEDLILDLEKQAPLARDRRVVRDYLQEAWRAEQLIPTGGPEAAVEAYRRLLDCRIIRQAELDESTLEGRIKLFATHRMWECSQQIQSDLPLG